MNAALYLNRFMTSFADYGLMFLIPLSVFQITDSASLAGLAFSIEYLVKVAAGPLTGSFVDRVPLVTLLNWVNGGRALTCVVCAVWLLLAPGMTPLVVLAVCNGVGYTVNFMAQETLLTDLVPKSLFSKVQAQVQSLEQVALVGSPMAAAGLLLWVSVPFLVVAISVLYAVSIALLAVGIGQRFLPPPPDHQVPLANSLKDNFRVGQAYLLRSGALRKVVASTFLINLIFATLLAIGAPVVVGVFEGTAADYAQLQAAGALAAVGVLLLLSRYSHWLTSTGWGRVSFVMMSVGGLVASLAQHYALFLLGAVLVLAFDGMFSVYIRTRRMEIIARRDYGKAMGLLMVVNNLSKPVSGLLVFALSGWLSVQQVLLLSTLMAIGCILGFRLLVASEPVPVLNQT